MASSAVGATLRPSLRPSLRLLIRQQSVRTASSTAEAASSGAAKAKDVAASATSKASSGLSKVTSSASSTLSKAGATASSLVNSVGGRTGRVIGLVQSDYNAAAAIPPTVYYSKVFWELSKMVFRNQKMSPPSSAQVQTYWQWLLSTARNPASLFSKNPGLLNPQQLVENARNVSTTQLATIGVVAAEVLGFFTVGEIIGKLKIVGYRGKVEHEHH